MEYPSLVLTLMLYVMLLTRSMDFDTETNTYRSRGACQIPPVLCLHLFLSTVQSFSTTPLSLHCSVLNQLLAHSPTSFCHLPHPPGRARHIHQSHTIKMLPSQHGGAIGRTIIETMIYGPHQVCNCVFTCVGMLLRNGTA